MEVSASMATVPAGEQRRRMLRLRTGLGPLGSDRGPLSPDLMGSEPKYELCVWHPTIIERDLAEAGKAPASD